MGVHKQTETILDVVQEKSTDDCWNLDGPMDRCDKNHHNEQMSSGSASVDKETVYI